MAETIHRLKSVVCFLFGAVRSSQKMGSRLAFSLLRKEMHELALKDQPVQVQLVSLSKTPP